MLCPRCGSDKVTVRDSRASGMYSVRRRRRCTICSARWTTYETVFNPEEFTDTVGVIRQKLKEIRMHLNYVETLLTAIETDEIRGENDWLSRTVREIQEEERRL